VQFLRYPNRIDHEYSAVIGLSKKRLDPVNTVANMIANTTLADPLVLNEKQEVPLSLSPIRNNRFYPNYDLLF